ncbi:MAG: hypothetical protein ABSC23_02320 [Bryobacteraceae bacterium]|jgi:hypothetical protein
MRTTSTGSHRVRSLLKSDVVYLGLLLAGLFVALLVVSQTAAFSGDEGYNLNAARLVNAGKRPYLDFFYQQAPLYLYLNAAWMRVFGETWRSSHVLSVLFTAGCLALIIEYLLRRFRDSGRGPATAAMAGFFLVFSIPVVEAGCVSQPYAACLFWSAAAFRLAVARRPLPGLAAFGSGLCAGAAVASSLLAAPLLPVLLCWTAQIARSGERRKRSFQYLAGAGIAFLPLLTLAFHGPRQALFDVVEFHLFYRVTGWGWQTIAKNNFACVLGLVDSPQGILLILGAAAWFATRGRETWGERTGAEIRLSAWLAACFGVYLFLVAPTYETYFVLMTPFVAMLSAAGAASLGMKLPSRRIRALSLVMLLALYFPPAARWYHRQMAAERWDYWEGIAAKVAQVTPPDEDLYSAWDVIYFLRKRPPPLGFENVHSFGRLPVPVELASRLHVVAQSQVGDWWRSARFTTVITPTEDSETERLGLRQVSGLVHWGGPAQPWPGIERLGFSRRMLDWDVAMFRREKDHPEQ